MRRGPPKRSSAEGKSVALVQIGDAAMSSVVVAADEATREAEEAIERAALAAEEAMLNILWGSMAHAGSNHGYQSEASIFFEGSGTVGRSRERDRTPQRG